MLDCHSALERLDIARFDGDDLQEPEFADAVAHLEKCEACAKHFSAFREFDREIADALFDVEIPENGMADLLAVLAERETEGADSESSTESVPQPDHATAPRRRRGRWGWASAAIAAAACLALAVGVWRLRPDNGVQYTLTELTSTALLVDFASRPPADAVEGAQRLPQLWQRETIPQFDIREYRVIPAEESTGEPVAWLASFELTRGKRGPISGLLLMIPADRVAQTSTASNMVSAPVEYHTGGWASKTWTTHSGQTYVCFVRGGGDDLEVLANALLGTAA